MQLFSILQALKDVKALPISLYAIGGGVSYPKWIQILSDVFGNELVIPAVTSPEATGAAMLAGIGIGEITDLREPAYQKHVTPHKHAHRIYGQTYDKYKRICDVLASS
jgi:sugar (pentulose or hexulose) kinase